MLAWHVASLLNSLRLFYREAQWSRYLVARFYGLFPAYRTSCVLYSCAFSLLLFPACSSCLFLFPACCFFLFVLFMFLSISFSRNCTYCHFIVVYWYCVHYWRLKVYRVVDVLKVLCAFYLWICSQLCTYLYC